MLVNEILIERRIQKTRIMYHGSSTTKLKSILKYGLLPNIQDKSSWPPSYGGAYLTSSKNYAERSAGVAVNRKGGEPILVTAQYVMTSGGIDEDILFEHFEIDRVVRNFIRLNREDFYDRMTTILYNNLKRVATITAKTIELIELWVTTVYDHVYSSGKQDLEAVASTFLNSDEMRDLTTQLIDSAKARHVAGLVRLDRPVGFRGKTRILKIENLKTGEIYYQDPNYTSTSP